MKVTRRLIKVWQRNLDVFVTLWHSEAPGFVAEPVIILVTMGLGLGAYVGLVDGQDYIQFITPGIIASYAMYSATFECTYGSYVRMEYQRTYDAILATPVSANDIVAGEILWGASRAALTGTSILVVAAFFNLVDSFWAILIPVFCLVQGLLFSALSLIFTAYVPTLYSFNYYFTLLITPMFFFSGVFFPLTSFPQVVQNLSWIVPLTPVVYVTRQLLTGNFDITFAWSLALVIFSVVVLSVIGLIAMRRRLIY